MDGSKSVAQCRAAVQAASVLTQLSCLKTSSRASQPKLECGSVSPGACRRTVKSPAQPSAMDRTGDAERSAS